MKTTLILSALAGLCAVLPTSLQAQSVLIDFSSAATITDNLNKGTIINQTGTALGTMGNVTYSPTTGLGGGGGGQNPAATTDIFMYGTKQAFASSFTTATIGVYVQIKAGTLGGAGLSLTSGFSNLSTPESGLSGGPAGNFTGVPRPTTLAEETQNSVTVVLRGTTGTPDLWNFGAYNNSVVAEVNSSSISLTAGNWYFWETVYTNNGGGSLSFTADLYASDANGTISGTSLLTYTQTISNSALLSDDLYGFIGSQNGDRRGIAQIDNLSFAAIPEPAQFGSLLGLIALVGALNTRRRHS